MAENSKPIPLPFSMSWSPLTIWSSQWSLEGFSGFEKKQIRMWQKAVRTMRPPMLQCKIRREKQIPDGRNKPFQPEVTELCRYRVQVELCLLTSSSGLSPWRQLEEMSWKESLWSLPVSQSFCVTLTSSLHLLDFQLPTWYNEHNSNYFPELLWILNKLK